VIRSDQKEPRRTDSAAHGRTRYQPHWPGLSNGATAARLCVRDCLGADRAPFSQGALVAFRERLIAHDLGKVLRDKTVALAKVHEGFGWQHLRAALDSSPPGCRTYRGHVESSPRAGDRS
jgi:hypothetical protein